MLRGRVMVIDDERLVRDLLAEFLAGEDFDVARFASGAEALAAVSTFQPDVILVDMLMPGMSGNNVLDALRRDGVTVPVILLSGTPSHADEGFFQVLMKPFELRALADAVAAALTHRRHSG